MKKVYLLLFFAFLFGSTQLSAEGSVDFINYPGHRLFLRSDKDQQMKVYAHAGEFINVGSSHTGFDGGLISVYRPDGTLHTVFDGSDGSTGIIFNNIEELNGPTGAANNGYTPGVVQVTAATEGIWSVIYSVPDFTGATFTNLLNNAPWTRENDQPTNRRVITSWDITVSENTSGPEGGNLLTGRVYTNEYNSMINMNGTTTSPQFFVLTPDGLLYTVDFMETDPWGFPLSSSSLGLLNADQSPSYQSWPETALERSADPTSWQDGIIYQYEPQAEDFGDLINNKIFFNLPDVNMPSMALATDIFRDNTHITWLYTEPFVFEIIFNDFTINGTDEEGEACNVDGLQYNQGAYFVFDTSIPGNIALELDLNFDGDMDDPEDLIVYGYVNAGIDSIYWNGGDGQGNPIPVQENFTFNFQFFLRGGESHIMLSDVENNTGGVVFELLSEVGAIQTDLFYYDHTPVGGGVSGGGTAGNPLATNVPYTYDNQFGNKKALDYWAYVVYGDTGDGNISIDIVEDCTDYSGPDTDGDGIGDSIDLDDDNDGIPDYLEYCMSNDFSCLPGGFDPSGNEDDDPYLNYEDADDANFTNPCTDLDADGVCDFAASIYDTDNDGIINSLDLDSDNDGITDLFEAKHDQLDLNLDGIIDGDSLLFGENGFFNILASNPDALNAVAVYTPSDKDNDEIFDAYDLDSDNDGINDLVEAGEGYADNDNDGLLNNSPVVVDGFGLATSLNGTVGNPVDTDTDGLHDFRDLDSDNDAINDVEEGGNLDPDDDGIVGTGTPIINDNGQTNGSNSDPTDTDEDGMPDYLDLDSDNDNVSDVVEGGNLDPDDDGIVGTATPIVNEDGQPDGNTSNPPDTDEDGDPDYQDIDADGDGIVDIYECPDDNTCVDSDEDGIPDFLDQDSDGDGINDMDECETGAPCVDTDNDGIPDFLDIDTDNDGILDEDECVDGAPCPDTDMDGIPDWRDPACEISIEAITGAGMYCEGENINLGATTNVEGEEINFVWTNTTNGNTFPGTTMNDPGMSLVFINANASHSGNYILSITTPSDDCTISSAEVFVNVIMTPETPILTAENTSICIGSTMTLNTNPNGGAGMTYQWFNGDTQVAETAIPSLVIENVTAEQSGTYTVIAFNENCPSEVSNAIEIMLVDMEDNVTATNTTSAENPACLASDITLSVANFDGATVEWFGPNGTSVGNTFSLILTNITEEEAGEYYAVITFETCGELTSSTTEVFTQSNNITPELNADNDEICAGQSIVLNVINDLGIEAGDNVTYTWYNAAGEQVAVTSEGNYNFENVNIEGDLSVVVNINGCAGTGGNFYVTVLETPDEFANIPQNLIYFCADEALEIQAVAGTESEGMWRSLGAATVLNPNNNISLVNGLVEGPNVFVWALSIELCGEFSTDTVTVFAPASLQAFDDAAIVEQNEALENMDASENDVISYSNGVTFNIVTEPQNGTASMTEAGVYSYIPNEDYEGEDEFIYSLCSNECPDDCVTASVKITVNNTVFVDDCFVPNGITPNGDGANDALEIPCLNDNNFSNNHIAIFNRWGDKVYEKTGYANDWLGTYKGNQLPAGTYFYILEIEPGSTPLQDFFTIVY